MPPKGSLLPPPPNTRRGVPIYFDKTEEQYRNDVYERYDELVTRQTLLHLADELHGGYPFQPLQDYINHWLPDKEDQVITDLGCSVGRLIGDLATRHPSWDCYGIDASYQMIRQGRAYWQAGETLRPRASRYGWADPVIEGRQLANLELVMGRAQSLPFPDISVDVLFNTFLIDRLPKPTAGLAEWGRVLKPGGRLIVVSPLNFLNPDGWSAAHPPVKLLDLYRKAGWEIMDWTDPLELREPMDARGNGVVWRCVAFVVTRG